MPYRKLTRQFNFCHLDLKVVLLKCSFIDCIYCQCSLEMLLYHTTFLLTDLCNWWQIPHGGATVFEKLCQTWMEITQNHILQLSQHIQWRFSPVGFDQGKGTSVFNEKTWHYRRVWECFPIIIFVQFCLHCEDAKWNGWHPRLFFVQTRNPYH